MIGPEHPYYRFVAPRPSRSRRPQSIEPHLPSDRVRDVLDSQPPWSPALAAGPAPRLPAPSGRALPQDRAGLRRGLVAGAVPGPAAAVQRRARGDHPHAGARLRLAAERARVPARRGGRPPAGYRRPHPARHLPAGPGRGDVRVPVDGRLAQGLPGRDQQPDRDLGPARARLRQRRQPPAPLGDRAGRRHRRGRRRPALAAGSGGPAAPGVPRSESPAALGRRAQPGAGGAAGRRSRGRGQPPRRTGAR
jgi:hypothetical protein